MIVAVESLAITSRSSLRPGTRFRVRRGSGPRHSTTGKPAGVRKGVFLCLRLWKDSKRPSRIYCDALDTTNGGEHALYVDGPKHRCPQLSTLVIRPYRIALLPAGAVPRKPRRKRQPCPA